MIYNVIIGITTGIAMAIILDKGKMFEGEVKLKFLSFFTILLAAFVISDKLIN